MPDLRVALASHEALRAELLARWPELAEDEQAQTDTLEGVSSLPDMIAHVLRSAVEDEHFVLGLSEHIDRLRARQKRLRERAERKRAMALHYCQEGRIKRVQAPDLTASVGMTRGKVIVTDEAALSMKWLRVKTEPDRVRIGDALRAGETIEGATLGNPQPTIAIRST